MNLKPGWKYKVEEFRYRKKKYENVLLKRYEYLDTKFFWRELSLDGAKKLTNKEHLEIEKWYQQYKREQKLNRILFTND